ncbi:putative ribonuclease H-like domain-containing protein [Tanacetum coccineum]
MSGLQDDIPPPSLPLSQTQTPTQQTPHTVSTIKLPILKKGEYDIWVMKMEHYLAHTDYPIWEVIQHGNGLVSINTDIQGQIKVLPPKTAEEILARERERKARTTLLMSLLEDHLAKFHKITNAKEMWESIKSRFGGNVESKKMQKYILKQQFKGFSVSNSEGLHKGYDRFLESSESTRDSWCRVFESDVKGSTTSSSSMQNMAFVSKNTSSTNDVAMISMRMKKFYKKTGKKLQFDAKEPVGFDKTKVECYNCYKIRHFARECRTKGNQDSRKRDAWNSGNKDKEYGRRTGKLEDSKALVTIDGEGVDWTSHSQEEEYYALMACNSSGSDTEVQSCSNECVASYNKLKRLYDEQRAQLSDASIEIQAYTQALKKVEAQLVAHQQGQLCYEQKIKFMKIDLDDKTDMSANDKFRLGYGDHRYDGILSYENKVLQSVFMNKESDLANQLLYDRFVIVEGMHVPQPSESDIQTSDFDTCESNINVETPKLVFEPVVNASNVECQSKVWVDAPIIEEYEETVKNYFTHSKNPNVDKKGLGYGFATIACFVCESLSHLIRDCDFHEKRMAKQVELNNRKRKDSSQREIRPIWNNVQRVNHQNQFVPTAVLTRTGKILVNTARASGTNNVSTARHNLTIQAIPFNGVRKVSSVKPSVQNAKVNTVKTKLVLLGKKGKLLALQNKGIVDSGCSRHMTGNKAYLAEYQDLMVALLLLEEVKHFNLFSVSQICDKKNKVLFTDTECLVLSPEFKLPDENQVLLRIPRQNNMHSFNLENIVPSGGLACLIAKAIIDESNKWHWRFSWVFFLRTKDETSGILKDFIRQIENQLNQKVKTIRSDNGTEFKKRDFIEFCVSKGIKREYRKGPTWLFDLDYLTDSMNYQPVRSENQANNHAGPEKANHSAGTQDNIDAGDSDLKAESAQDSFVLPIWSSYSSTVKSSKARSVGEEPNKHLDSKSNEKPVDKEDQVFLDELQRLKRQEHEAHDAAEAHRKEFEKDTEDLLFQYGAAKASGTNPVNTASTPVSTANPYGRATKASGPNTVNTASTPISTTSPYGGLSFIELTNADQDDSEIHALEEIYNNPTDGIFNHASYDDEGAVADFTNLETVLNVSPIPTSRINSIHPSTLILGDLKSAVQIRSKILVDLPYGKKAIRTKWVYRNKKDERGVVVRNKVRLVAQGHRQEEGIDYDEVFAPVARIEAIRIFLAFASYMGFIVYQMDVKISFLYSKIDEEVYVSQPQVFIDPKYLKKVYKVVKALYGLHQAPRAWYATLSTFLLKNRYRRGTIDKTLFIKKDKKDIMLVQVYVDDIIFGSIKKSWCDKFEALMKSRFQMSSMGELTSFLGLQVKQKEDGIFISQDKYVAEILKKFDFVSVKTASTPIETQKPFRFQVTPKTSHLHAVKRIFRYLKGKPKLGLWYPRVSLFDLEAYSDSDYAGANLDRKSTTREAEYVATANCCRQVLWIQNQMLDYGFNFMNTKIYIDNESTICIVKNPVYHSKTKHIAIRHHFIRDAYEKKLIQVLKIYTDDNVADLLTKASDVSRFQFLVVTIKMINP